MAAKDIFEEQTRGKGYGSFAPDDSFLNKTNNSYGSFPPPVQPAPQSYPDDQMSVYTGPMAGSADRLAAAEKAAYGQGNAAQQVANAKAPFVLRNEYYNPVGTAPNSQETVARLMAAESQKAAQQQNTVPVGSIQKMSASELSKAGLNPDFANNPGQYISDNRSGSQKISDSFNSFIGGVGSLNEKLGGGAIEATKRDVLNLGGGIGRLAANTFTLTPMERAQYDQAQKFQSGITQGVQPDIIPSSVPKDTAQQNATRLPSTSLSAPIMTGASTSGYAGNDNASKEQPTAQATAAQPASTVNMAPFKAQTPMNPMNTYSYKDASGNMVTKSAPSSQVSSIGEQAGASYGSGSGGGYNGGMPSPMQYSNNVNPVLMRALDMAMQSRATPYDSIGELVAKKKNMAVANNLIQGAQQYSNDYMNSPEYKSWLASTDTNNKLRLMGTEKDIANKYAMMQMERQSQLGEDSKMRMIEAEKNANIEALKEKGVMSKAEREARIEQINRLPPNLRDAAMFRLASGGNAPDAQDMTRTVKTDMGDTIDYDLSSPEQRAAYDTSNRLKQSKYLASLQPKK